MINKTSHTRGIFWVRCGTCLPRRLRARPTQRSDVYSLGLTLYEMLAFRPAFAERERNRLIRRVTNDEPERLDRLNPRVPRDLVTVVHKAIERDPQGRYATAKELAADLERFIDDEPILARRQTELERYVRWARHNPGIAALGAVLTAVLVVVTIGSVIVSGHMISLANEAAQKAADERSARFGPSTPRRGRPRNGPRPDMAKKAAENSFAEARGGRGTGPQIALCHRYATCPVSSGRTTEPRPINSAFCWRNTFQREGWGMKADR